MPKFTVKCLDITPVEVEVEANSQEEANEVVGDEGISGSVGVVVSSKPGVRLADPGDASSAGKLAEKIRKFLFED